MKTTTTELHRTMSGFARDRQGSSSLGTRMPIDGQVHRTSHSIVVDDADEIQWSFCLEASSPGLYSVLLQDGLIKDEPILESLTLNVKHGDQETWKTYDLTSLLQNMSVPTDLSILFSQVMTSPLYSPLERTEPQAVKKPRNSKDKALVADCEELLETLSYAGYESDLDAHDEPVITVSKPGEIFDDMNVYLEFKKLDDSTDGFGAIVLFGGSQETLSQKKNAGIFDTSDIGTTDDLLKALEGAFIAWEQAMEAFH